MYVAQRPCHSEFVAVRGLRYHVRVWEPVDTAEAGVPVQTWFLLHGWMDVSASFQFLVDCLPGHWRLLAPDWRGYGLTEWPAADCYWFPDYLGDLDALLDHYSGEQPAHLIGHSMGGNACTLYSGVRPNRVARLINLEGLGLQPSKPEDAPVRYSEWLAELKSNQPLRRFDSMAAVAERLCKNNPRLRESFAHYLAQHWARADGDGQFSVRGDAKHKIVNANVYQIDEVNACWARIEAPVLWVFAEHNPRARALIGSAAYEARLSKIRRLQRLTVADAGHMLHHDQPEVLARAIVAFAANTLDGPTDRPVAASAKAVLKVINSG